MFFVSFVVNLRADIITGMVNQVTADWRANDRIMFTPMDTPKNINGVLISSRPSSVNAGTNGWVSNYLAGPVEYKITAGPQARDIMTIFTVGDGGTYDWLSLTTNASLANTSNPVFILRNQGTGESNRFTTPRLFETPWGTNAPGSSNYVWALTNVATGEGEWRPGGSGSGDVSSAQLDAAFQAATNNTVTASNALRTDIAAVDTKVGVASNALHSANSASSNALHGLIRWGVRPTFYIDPLNGSDSNTGTNLAVPWLTFAKLTNTVGQFRPTNVNVFFARGTTLREEVKVGSQVTLDAYGNGALPIINAGEVATNWGKADGWTNTYAQSNWVVSATGVGNTMSVIEADEIMQYKASIAEVDATPGTYYAPSEGSIVGTNIVYMHPRTGGDPNTNGLVYEVSTRKYAILGGTNVTVRNLHTKNQMGNNGSIDLARGALIQNAIVQNGHKHSALIAGGAVEDTLFLFADYSAGGSMLVIYDANAAGQSAIVRRCRFVGSKRYAATASAMYGHNGPNTASGYVLVEDCVVEDLQGAGNVDRPMRLDWVRTQVIRSKTAFSVNGGTNNFIDCRYFPDTSGRAPQQVAAGGGAFSVTADNNEATRMFISGFGIVATGDQFPIKLASSTNVTIEIHNSSFINEEPTAFNHVLRVIAPSTNCTVIVSNTIVHGFNLVFNLDTGNEVLAAGDNVFSGPFARQQKINGTTYSDWESYTNAFDSLALDRNTFTNSARINYPLTLFEVATNSPAVTNTAGLGWFRRLPADISAQAIPHWEQPRLGRNFESGSPFIESIGGAGTGNTFTTPTLSGNWTNSGGTLAYLAGANNMELRLVKQAPTHSATYSVYSGTGEIGRLWSWGSATNELRLQTSSGRNLRLFAPNTPLLLDSAGSNVVEMVDGSSRVAFVDRDGRIGMVTNSASPTDIPGAGRLVHRPDKNLYWRNDAGTETLLTAGGAGEANTAANLGGGLNTFDSKSGVDLRFNTIASTGDGVTISSNANLFTVNLNWATAASQTNLTAASNAISAKITNSIATTNGVAVSTATDTFDFEDSTHLVASGSLADGVASISYDLASTTGAGAVALSNAPSLFNLTLLGHVTAGSASMTLSTFTNTGNAYFQGDVTFEGDNVNIQGQLTGTSATLSGSLSADSVSAGSGTFSGALSADSAAFNTATLGLITVTNASTNLLHATDQTIYLDRWNDTVDITNAVAANVSCLLTNPVPGASGSIAFTSDGSARTFSFFSIASMTWMSTNGVVSGTNFQSTASKQGLISYVVRRKSATETNVMLWGVNEP